MNKGKNKDKKLQPDVKPRYLWSYVGSDRVNLPWKDYDIIDTYEDKVIESHNSLSMVLSSVFQIKFSAYRVISNFT